MALEIRHPLKRTPGFLVIDLDGTMVDSVPDLTYCVDKMMETLGLPARGTVKVRQWVGNGVEKLVARALSNDLAGEITDPVLYERALAIFRPCYQDRNAVDSYVYPHVKETLHLLKSHFPLVSVTNKAAQFTEPLLRDLGLWDFFRFVISGDTLPEKKPHPAPLLYAAKTLGFLPEEGLMVGDSQSDIKAARAAGMPVVCLRDGYNHGQAIADFDPDAILDTFADLLTLLSLTP